MASAIDSGVDTGNDSNDSTIQEKLSIMDLETPQPKSSGSGFAGLGTYDTQHTFEAKLRAIRQQLKANITPGPARLLTHLQPSTLMHGYELRPKPPSGDNCYVVLPVKEIGGVFVSGGPFGTEYQGCKLATKLRAARRYGIGTSVSRFKCLRYSSWCHTSISDYCKLRDSLRLCRLACQNNTEGMRKMLESGLSPNVHDGYNRTPLHLAACMGYADMVKLLLDHGADPNAKDGIGNTPLHLAACTNHVAVITLLLKAGTRVSERDMAGHNPLQLAITKFNIMKRSLMPHPVLKEQFCQVISMLTEYMRRKEGATIDPDLLNKFESLVRVSDSNEQVESNIRDLLSNLSSLSISSTT